MEEGQLNSTNYNSQSLEYFPSNSSKQEGKSIIEAISNPSTLTISLLLLLLIIITLVGNSLICFTIYVTKRLQVAAFFFVASLAVADFMVGLLVIPIALVFQIAIEMKEYSIYTVEVCDVWIFASIWFSCASILNLCAISWDRYVAVTSPFRYGVRMRRSRVKIFLVYIWIFSFCLSCLAWLGVKASTNRIHFCSTEGMDLQYALPVVIALFVIPVVFLVFANSKIIVAARSQLKKIKTQSLNVYTISKDREIQSCAQRNAFQRKLESIRISKEIKTFKLFLTVIGVFVFCWLPFFVITLISAIKPITAVYDNIKLIFISLGYVNSACNVFIYGVFNKDFKKALTMAVRRKGNSRQRSQSVSSISGGTRMTTERGVDNESYVSSTQLRLQLNVCRHDVRGNTYDHVRERGVDNVSYVSFTKSRSWLDLCKHGYI